MTASTHAELAETAILHMLEGNAPKPYWGASAGLVGESFFVRIASDVRILAHCGQSGWQVRKQKLNWKTDRWETVCEVFQDAVSGDTLYDTIKYAVEFQ